MRIAVVALAGSLALTACADGKGAAVSNTTGGLAIGAATGGAIGAIVGGRQGSVIGAIAGATLGGFIGSRLDAESESRRQAALTELAQKAEKSRDASSDQSVAWSGPADRQTSGQIRTTSRPRMQEGKKCMSVTEHVTINGQPQRVDETRCLGPDGRWA